MSEELNRPDGSELIGRVRRLVEKRMESKMNESDVVKLWMLHDGAGDEALIDFVRKIEAAERERMVADGWRKTRYVSPVTNCEACLTEDACQIRGQCAHYLRETPNDESQEQPR